MPRVLAVISVMGRDQKGVVARFATYLAERGVNIEDIQQQVVQGQFIMDMLVDLTELAIRLDELVTGLLEAGKAIGMDVRVTLESQRQPKKIVVLVSKEPHCLERLLADQQAGLFKGRGQIQAVLSNHAALEPLAKHAGLPYAWLSSHDKAAHFQWLLRELKGLQPDVIVLARYMQVLSSDIVNAYPQRIINIHPSLLPHFPGPAPYKQAHASGVRVTGCTAHFVTESLDQGPIVLQDVFHIDVGTDSEDDVKRKGQALEATVLSSALRMFLDEKLVVVEDKVVFRPGLSVFEQSPGGW